MSSFPPHETNPFPTSDPDRHALWEMLVRRDIDAFIASDWGAVESDFDEETFFALNAGFHANPDSWGIGFSSLEAYREAWLTQAESFKNRKFKIDPRRALFEATTMRDIEINGSRAVLHKKFDGWLDPEDGPREPLLWQTLYQCRKQEDGEWRIVGFLGYLPNPLSSSVYHYSQAAKRLPAGAGQHTSAGPYSPLLEVEPGRLVVISGQAAIDPAGNVVGGDIESQTAYTLDNCLRQLSTAGCGFQDVFKVNVYLIDLEEWPRFNKVYARAIPEPRPVRTAVGAKLLPGLRVEVEMWAVKKGA